VKLNNTFHARAALMAPGQDLIALNSQAAAYAENNQNPAGDNLTSTDEAGRMRRCGGPPDDYP